MSPKEKAEQDQGNESIQQPVVTEAVVAKPKKRPWILLALLFVVAIAAFFGIRAWLYGRTHISTDDAYVTSHIVQIAPEVSGNVLKVLVDDNEHVTKGQLIAVLDDATYKAAVDQAQANLQLAMAQAKGASTTVGLTSQTTEAQIQQAQGAVTQNQAGVGSAVADLGRATAAEQNARAGLEGAVANVGSAKAAYQNALASIGKAKAAVGAAEAQVTTAQANARAATAGISAAQAEAQRAQKQAARSQTLYSQGAISQQQAEQAQAAAAAAAANLQSAQDQASAAQAVVRQRQLELDAARQQLDAAQAAAQQAQAQITASQAQVSAAKAGVGQAQATRAAAQQAITAAQAKTQQARGALSQAQTAPAQVDVSKSQQTQAEARVQQAQAALDSAKIQLARTKIYAPEAGTVSKLSVTVGQLVQSGTPLMAIVPDETMWVVANYKETQLKSVRIGQPAEVEVDALGGETLHGKVDSISAGTGSTFALLPPENATGNFTKVVQRVPIKITLDPNQTGIDRLRSGMSVNAVIEVQ